MVCNVEKPVRGFIFLIPLSALSIILILSLGSCSNIRTDNESEQNFVELNKLFDLASKKADSINPAKGIHFIDSALSGKKMGVREKFKVLAFKSGVYFYIKDTSNTMLYVDSMLRLVEESGKEKYKEEFALVNYSKGDVLFYEKKYNEAYTHYFLARYIGKSTVDFCTLSEYSYRIAMIQFQQSKFTESAQNFEEAFVQSENCVFDFSHYFRRQELLNNTGLCFLKAGKPDSALVYCDRALQYLKENDGKFKSKAYFNDIARAVIFETEGEVFKEQGKYLKAEELFKESIKINIQKGYDNRNSQLGQLNLAEVYYLNNRIDSMGMLLNEARRSLDTIQNEQAEMDWNRLMWKYNESKHEVAGAFKYLKNYTTLQDSAVRVQSELNLFDIGQQVKMLEDQYKITLLQRENKLKTLYLLIFLVTIALGITIFLFFLFTLRNTKKNYKVLQSLNNKIEEQKFTLEHALAQLKDRDREKDRILRIVAHDLRSPITSISMLADLISDETDSNAKTDMLGLIKSASDNSIALITEILEAADTEIKRNLQKEKVDVNSFLADAILPLRYKANEKQQSILLDLLHGKQNFLINKEKLKRVITNLITNAIKFSKTSSTIRVSAIEKENTIQIEIHDNGIGIPDNLKDKIFDTFTEAKRPGTEGEKAFGLGLSICKQIVEAHGGSIWFKSEEGQGTSFFIQLSSI